MLEFVILLLVIFDHEGERVGARAVPVANYDVCNQLADQIEAEAQLSNPSLEVRTACISSQAVKRLK